MIAPAANTLIAIPGFQDPVSSLTHLGGAVAFALVSIALVRRGLATARLLRAQGFTHQSPRTVSLVVFALSAVILLSFSGVFHLLGAGEARNVLQRLDHAAIFVLIAGTFTPIHAIYFRGPWRWGMLLFIWTVAIGGVTLKSIFFTHVPEWLGLALYVAMGWVGALSMFALTTRHGFRTARPLLLGGIAYTIGAAIELADPGPIIRGAVRAHEIFHVFVLLGLGLHYHAAWIAAGHPGPSQLDPASTPKPTRTPAASTPSAAA
jgi:channel protein (hemolysin III family)